GSPDTSGSVMISPCQHNDCVWKLAAIVWVMMAAIAASTNAGAQHAGDEIKRFELRIENGRLADAQRTIRVRRGDTVEITWHSDRPAVVHLHGYDIETSVDAGRPQIMSFHARATGRFAIELHGSTGSGHHAALTYLEVHPR